MANKTISFFLILILLLFSVWLFLPKNEEVLINDNKQMFLVKNGAGLGQDLYVPAKPQRVIFLNSSSFVMWVNLGGAKSVVGVPKFPSIKEEIYKKLPATTVILPNYSAFSMEKIILLKPDLVVMNGNEKRLELVNSFKQANIPLMTLPSNSFEDILDEIQVMGKLIDKEDKAAQEIVRIKNNIENNANKYKDFPRKKVVLIFGTSASFFMMTPQSRQGELLEMAGGINILPKEKNFLKDKTTSFSLEYIAKENPDFVFFINRGPEDKMQEKIKTALTENSAWNTLKAVRENKVYVLPAELFSISPGLRADEAVEYLSKLLYQKES